jgi:hypothetical protein
MGGSFIQKAAPKLNKGNFFRNFTQKESVTCVDGGSHSDRVF